MGARRSESAYGGVLHCADQPAGGGRGLVDAGVARLDHALGRRERLSLRRLGLLRHRTAPSGSSRAERCWTVVGRGKKKRTKQHVFQNTPTVAK